MNILNPALVLICNLCVLLLGDAACVNEFSLWYSQPATKQLQEFPVGNGYLGGMIFGGTTNERVQFNEQTRWLGSETEMGSYQPFGDVFVVWRHARRQTIAAS